jgi:hypothetical protein
MLAEVRTLFWLQWKLTLSMFRSRRLHVWARLGQILIILLMLVVTLPMFVAMGGFLGWGITRLSPQGSFELVVIVNSAMLFFWLLLPASYSSQIVERFEMSRLFVHPVQFKSLVAGSTLISLVSLTGVWTIPVLLGEVAGLAWHNPAMLPLVLLGTVPTFAILVLSGRLMDDLLDLVSSDRRLRGFLIFLMSLPFILLLFGNYAFQFASQNPDQIRRYVQPFLGNIPSLQGLGPAQAVDAVLTGVHLSRYLLWLPPGWATAGMGMASTGRLLGGIVFLGLSLAFSAGLLWAHTAVTRRLMQGDANLPGPPAFWTLFRKDMAYVRRSPAVVRALLATPIVAVAFGMAMWQMANALPEGNVLRQAVPILAAALVVVSANLGTSNLLANYFGAVDREGLTGLLLTPIDRRYVLLAANAAAYLFAMAQSLVLLLLVAVITRSWILVPWGLLLATCLHVGTAPFFHLSSILAPYRAPTQAWGGRGGNMGAFLAWMVGTPPILLLFLLPYFLWLPAQIVALPLAAVYAFGLYGVTLKPLAKLVDRRTHQIMEAIVEES